MAKFETTWEAPEFEYREKEVSWYWISIIAAALIIAFSVWEKDFLFAMVCVGGEQQRSGEIADQLGVKPTSIGPLRSSLIR